MTISFSLSKLLPKTCIICHFPADTELDICSVCLQALPWSTNTCYQCGALLASNYEAIRCNDCMVIPPKFARFCALFNYEFPINNFITKIKFHYKLAYANLLGQLLLRRYQQWYQDSKIPTVILPVPLAAARLKQRGFNQVVEILRPLAKATKLIILTDGCYRVKNTKPQTKMTLQNRRRNLRQAFKVSKAIPYEHVIIMDDVYTTGSTVNAMSEVLYHAGVQQIDVWCICRTQNLDRRAYS